MTTVTRRHGMIGFGAGLAAAILGRAGRAAATEAAASDLAREFAAIEAASGGRLGIAVIDTADGAQASHRGAERFPMCSTVKVLVTGAVLAKVDRGEETLDRRVTFAPRDVVSYSPMTQPRAGGEGMTIAELCEAALTLSDNTAVNVLLRGIGGTDGLTRYARSLGDTLTRLDRAEPDLNEALPGDARDTTSPLAMAENLRRLVLGDQLSPASRTLLTAWLVGNRTGDARIRAGLPKEWRVGDKTGSGDRNTANDVAILWPPRRAPLILTTYLTGAQAAPDARNATIASVARAVSAKA